MRNMQQCKDCRIFKHLRQFSDEAVTCKRCGYLKRTEYVDWGKLKTVPLFPGYQYHVPAYDVYKDLIKRAGHQPYQLYSKPRTK